MHDLQITTVASVSGPLVVQPALAFLSIHPLCPFSSGYVSAQPVIVDPDPVSYPGIFSISDFPLHDLPPKL
jgi:hypothetical protein